MPSAEEVMNNMIMGCDYSGLLATLSSKYCMCDMFEGYFDYQPLYSSLFDISSMLAPVSNIEKARSNLSTLSIPKASGAANSEEVLTPTTFENSPTVKNLGDSTFNQYMKEMASQLPLPQSNGFNSF